jgi:hypothetical protein
MNTKLSQKPKVSTKVHLSTSVKLLIGAGSILFVAAIILFIVLNTGKSTVSKAESKAPSGPASNNAFFDATADSYIDFGLGKNLTCIKNLPNGNKMTITMWVKWSSKTAPGVTNWANLFTLSDSTGNGDNGVFWVQHTQDNQHFEFALTTVGNGRQFIQSTTNPQEGVWYHLACVYNGAPGAKKMYLYVNGVLEAVSSTITGNIAAFSNTAKLEMGCWSNPQNSYRHFAGYLDEVTIWNTALSLTQINNMISDPTIVLGSSYNANGLLGYWNFDDLTATSLCGCKMNGYIGSGVTLPVEMISFAATSDNNQVILDWSTASEINNDYFSVERSYDLKSFRSIGIVRGAGNSNEVINYEYVDKDPGASQVYYRLKQVDFDGAFEYSKIVSATLSGVAEETGSVTASPNPFTSNINVNYTALVDGQAEVILYNSSGQTIASESMDVTTGDNRVSLNVPSELPSEYYFLSVIQNGKKTKVLKLLKSK